ncbi:NAD(P)/FAD-dependent oxidoreductase [Streptococcus ictaluri]|uniref:NAD(P)/FAD-dependent oxidoreductase n=1 Tax=Streptococcus ictaluri TaxID=380397 RepID=UPI0006810222
MSDEHVFFVALHFTTRELIIIGAGAAGIGFACALKRLKQDDFLVLEKGEIGDSFLKWPKTTRFITPSFTTNGFGFPDINAVVPNTSPAFTFEKEHLSGPEYAHYLSLLAKTYELPIKTQTSVTAIHRSKDIYELDTSDGKVSCDYLIMACGEFQLPNTQGIKGAELGMHYGQVDSFHVQSENPFIVIGGNESACDALTNLAYLGNEIHLFTNGFGKSESAPDPSISLSPITKERLKHIQENPQYHVHINEGKIARQIDRDEKGYQVTFQDGTKAHSKHKPILATGFRNASQAIGGQAVFDYDNDGIPQVTKDDESTISPNCFLIGPSLRHDQTIFCYIYKFRQRFLPIIAEIAKRDKWTLDSEEIDFFKANQMYLDNLDCCDVTYDC